MDTSFVIKKQIEAIGNTVHLLDDDWVSAPFKAIVNLLWRRKSSAFEANATEIGFDNPEYYLYIGPSNHDITCLSENAILTFGDKRYSFIRRDAVMSGDNVIYYTGVLKLIKEGEYDEY